MENTQLVMKKGKAMYSSAKVFAVLLVIGLVGVMITMAASGKYFVQYLGLAGPYFIVNLMMALWYIFLLLGFLAVPCYFIGLILIGIGQVCVNTIPKPDVPSRQAEKPAFIPVPAPIPTPAPAPAPAPAPTPAPAAQKSGGGISVALTNSLRAALNEPFDTDMIKRLEEAEQRLMRPNEKQIVARILTAPTEKIRQITQQIYDKLTGNA